MKTTDSTKEKTSKKTIAKKETKKVKPKSDAASGLTELFEDELKDIYWAEKKLTKAIPKMAKNASSPDLVKALNNHLIETEEHVARLEKIFELIGKKPQAKKCDAMAGLVEEGTGIIEETEIGVVRDAGIIAACQKVEHYEIATYGTMRQFAETLGMKEVMDLLATTLAEEKEADKNLTIIAVDAINIEAAHED